MILYLFLLILVAIIFFFIGFCFGKNKSNYSNPKKTYDIDFDKLEEKGYVIKSSVLVNKIVNYCDSIGVEILNLEISDWGRGELKVKCDKNQYFLLVSEISQNEYRINVKKISF